MRKIIILSSLFFISNLKLLAQRELNNPLVNSKEIIAKGVALHDEGKYKEAIAEYLKVPVSDTGYADVLHELILSYYQDSNFVVAEKYATEALKLFPEKNTEWYGLLANIYDDTKRADLTLKAYDTILAQNPYSYLTYLNKGITLFRLERMNEAEKNFRQCAIINPYYPSAHYYLGRLALLKGNIVQAMLSFTTNLMVSPGNRYHNTSVTYLSGIAQINTSTAELLQKYKPGKDDDFETLQEIITSKIALDKKYKLKTDLEDNIVRQLQVMMEKLEYNANDKGFWMQYYVPLYKKLWDNNQFEPMIYYIFSELDIKQVKEYARKEKKKTELMTNEAVNYLNMIRETEELDFLKREKATTRYYIQNYQVTGKGAYAKNAKNQDIVTGPWEFYFTNGRIKSKGEFDREGLRQGEWSYFYETGMPKEVSHFEKDKVQGKSTIWHDNGLVYKKVNYVNDEKDGEEQSWFFNGLPNSAINYKAGKREGAAKFYNVDGYLKTVATYSNDLQEGDETTYYENGAKESMSKYSKDLPTAEYREYFENGKVKMNGSFTDGKKTGIWKTYFKNGQQESLENYIKGELDGDYTLWYDNGKIESKRFYIKGEVDGKKEDFDDDGVVFCESIFERGRLRDIKFFDKKGNVISNTTSRKGNADISFFAPDGSKTSDGYYSKEGVQEGKGNYYYKNGQVSTEANYKNGLLEGKRTLFYENGKLKQEGTYSANDANGYFTDYYENGEVSEECWYVDGKRQGTLYTRNLLGKISAKYYYLNDNVHGIAEYYYPTGQLDYKAYYDNGWFNKIEQFDSTGKLICASGLNKGEGKLFFKHQNGKPYSESNYKYYKLNGLYTITNGDGSKNSISYYKNGDMDSIYTAWFPNGKIKQEGKYKNGNKTGQWKNYWQNGQLASLDNYEEGKLEGMDIQYNEDGTVDKEMLFKNGDLDGEYKMYSGNKELAVMYYFKDGYLTGYSYEGKDGKMVPLIATPKGSGKVTAYFKNGSKSAEMTFNENNVDGPRNLYFSNGKEYITGQRINGLDNGIKKIYYPSGKIMKEENYFYGKLHGTVKYYNENGTLISDLQYYLGDLHGECRYYTAGKLTNTYLYYYGVLESAK